VNLNLDLECGKREGKREPVQRDALQVFTQRNRTSAKGGLLAKWRASLELWSATGLADPSETQHRHRYFSARRAFDAALAGRRHELRGQLARRGASTIEPRRHTKTERSQSQHQRASRPRRGTPRHRVRRAGRAQAGRKTQCNRDTDQKRKLECGCQQGTRERPNQRWWQMLSGDPRPESQAAYAKKQSQRAGEDRQAGKYSATSNQAHRLEPNRSAAPSLTGARPRASLTGARPRASLTGARPRDRGRPGSALTQNCPGRRASLPPPTEQRPAGGKQDRGDI